MAVHLIPFVAGAVIGGLAAYFYRDERLRGEVRKTVDDVSDKVSEGLHGLRERVSGGREEAPPTKKTTRRAAAKKVAAKKAAARKKAARSRAAPKKTGAARTEPRSVETDADTE
jgi:hypothetical protein